MKKLSVLILALAMGLTGCGDKEATAPAVTETEISTQATQSPEESRFSFEGTVFTYDGVDYDLSERGITAIMEVSPVGDMLVIEGHLGPDNARYFLFDEANGTFQEELLGNNMIWREGELDTTVYAFDGGLYRLDGTEIAQLELEEDEFVYDLAFTDDYSAVAVTVIDLDGDTRSLEVPL